MLRPGRNARARRGLRGAAAVALAALPDLAAAQDVPSGQPVAFVETIAEDMPEGLLLRYRYIAPEAGALSHRLRETDTAHLCARHALPDALGAGRPPARIVVSLAEAPVDFGVYDADVAQFFEAYRIKDSRCIWEAF
ncbi:DUF6497 family protein [Rhodosalinus sp.]|uniref:DUF6497 family protein n=1 Tax=Rhodosalinus sp. TaxID=2047741 RepID=UPI00397D0CB1